LGLQIEAVIRFARIAGGSGYTNRTRDLRMMIKNRTPQNRRKEWHGELADRDADPRWRSFVMTDHRFDVDALHDHMAGWAGRPRPGVPKARGGGLN
jgi:hypothetical protein